MINLEDEIQIVEGFTHSKFLEIKYSRCNSVVHKLHLIRNDKEYSDEKWN